jgi:hypothetical protein
LDLKSLSAQTEFSQEMVGFSVCSELMIEAVEDGALVFNLSSGATTLISKDALVVVNIMRRLGKKVDQSELEVACSSLNSDGSDLSGVLASLEKSLLVFRC